MSYCHYVSYYSKIMLAVTSHGACQEKTKVRYFNTLLSVFQICLKTQHNDYGRKI
jgi:hypothetical protein